jgi:hypothetical protein
VLYSLVATTPKRRRWIIKSIARKKEENGSTLQKLQLAALFHARAMESCEYDLPGLEQRANSTRTFHFTEKR